MPVVEELKRIVEKLTGLAGRGASLPPGAAADAAALSLP